MTNEIRNRIASDILVPMLCLLLSLSLSLFFLFFFSFFFSPFFFLCVCVCARFNYVCLSVRVKGGWGGGVGGIETEVGLQKTRESFHHPLLFSLFSPALLFILLRVKFDSFLCFFSFLFCCGFCFLIIVITVNKATKNIKKAITIGRKRVGGGGGAFTGEH